MPTDANGRACGAAVAMNDDAEGIPEAASTYPVVPMSIGAAGRGSEGGDARGHVSTREYVQPVEEHDVETQLCENVRLWEQVVRDESPDVLPGHVKLTLFVLGTYADWDGKNAFPSAETIGEKTGKHERRVRADLALAERCGYISRKRRNRQKTYRYWLTVPAPTGHERPVASGHPCPDTSTGDQASNHGLPFGQTVETQESNDDASARQEPRAAGEPNTNASEVESLYGPVAEGVL